MCGGRVCVRVWGGGCVWGEEGMALARALNATISSSVQIIVNVKFRLIRLRAC